MDRGRVPQDQERIERELDEVRDATGRAEREGRWEAVQELRRRAQELVGKFQAGRSASRERERQEIKHQVERLMNEARAAKEQGRLEEAERLGQEAKRLERRLQEPGPGEPERQEIKRQIERLREQSREAKAAGRHEEAEQLWQKADRLEQRLREPGPREEDRMGPRGPSEIQEKIVRSLEEFKQEIGRLWQAVNEMRGRLSER